MNILTKTATTMSSREFNQDTARAKRAAKDGPVIITDRGTPSHVLMTMEQYEQLERLENPQAEPRKFRSLADALEQKEGGDFDFQIPEFKGHSLKPPSFD